MMKITNVEIAAIRSNPETGEPMVELRCSEGLRSEGRGETFGQAFSRAVDMLLTMAERRGAKEEEKAFEFSHLWTLAKPTGGKRYVNYEAVGRYCAKHLDELKALAPPVWRPAPKTCEAPGFYWVDKGQSEAVLNQQAKPAEPELRYFFATQSFRWVEVDGNGNISHPYKRIAGPVAVQRPADE